MTTNIDRAADIIDRLRLDSGPGDMSTAEHIARALADEGLLTPDLPEPTRTEEGGYALWRLDHIDISAETQQRSVYVEGDPLTPEQAREEAAALLAAADHAEGVGRA